MSFDTFVGQESIARSPRTYALAELPVDVTLTNCDTFAEYCAARECVEETVLRLCGL